MLTYMGTVADGFSKRHRDDHSDSHGDFEDDTERSVIGITTGEQGNLAEELQDEESIGDDAGGELEVI